MEAASHPVVLRHDAATRAGRNPLKMSLMVRELLRVGREGSLDRQCRVIYSNVEVRFECKADSILSRCSPLDRA